MVKYIFLLFAVVLCVAAAQAQGQQCPPNQQWTDCGSACQPKCNQPPAQFCTLQCIVGCQCKPGYVLKGKDCVTEDQC